MATPIEENKSINLSEILSLLEVQLVCPIFSKFYSFRKIILKQTFVGNIITIVSQIEEGILKILRYVYAQASFGKSASGFMLKQSWSSFHLTPNTLTITVWLPFSEGM